MSISALKKQVIALVEGQRFDELEALIAEQPRTLRTLLGLTYRTDDVLRAGGARGLALAARHHPEQIQKTVRKLLWAMNDESGTNALTAPEALVAIATERADLLLPMVRDIFRLASSDKGLHDGLAEALRLIKQQHPGEVGRRIGDELNDPQDPTNREREKRYARAKKALREGF